MSRLAGWARLAIPLDLRALRNALCRLLRVTGPPSCSRLCLRPWRVGAGNNHTGERCVRQCARSICRVGSGSGT